MEHFHDLQEALPTQEGSSNPKQKSPAPQQQSRASQQQRQASYVLDENTQRILIDQLFQRLQATQAQQQLQATATAPPEHSKKVPHVPMFSGTRSEYEGFKLNMMYKMRKDEPHFPSDEDKILYAFGRTEGKAQATILPWYNNTPQPGKTWVAFWDFLDSRYTDHQQKQNALQKLLSAKQNSNQPIRWFINEFEHNYSVSGNHYDDKTLIAFLQRAIKKELRDPLLVHRFSSFNDYKDALIHYEDAVKATHKRSDAPNHQPVQPQLQSQQVPDPQPEVMDWEPTPANKAKGQMLGQNKGQGGSRRRVKWVSKEVLEERRRKKLCMRCGAGGHFARDCPYLPPIRPAPTPTTISQSAPAPVFPPPELAESKPSEDEQPKEQLYL